MATISRAFLSSSDSAFKAIIEEHLKDRRPDLVRRVQAFVERNGSRLERLHDVRAPFSCIIHNDAWTNNFLFKYRVAHRSNF